MKRITLAFAMAAVLTGTGLAQTFETIKLLPHSTERGGNLMQAFQHRASEREYGVTDLTLQDLSDLLWAANGINRPESNKRTAPTAQNKQEISLYVVKYEGAYRYDAQTNILEPVTAGDHRAIVADRQEFAQFAPVILVIVGDYSVFPAERNMALVDAGYVSQNIYLFCAGNGMSTVARGTMKTDELAEILKLPEGQRPILNHPVGYRK